MKKLVVIPSDPLEAYEKAGYLARLLAENYFNPAGAFSRVFLLSPLEPQGHRKLGSLTVIGARGLHFPEVLAKIGPDLIRGYGGFWACDQAVYSGCLACPNTPLYISVHDSSPSMLHDPLLFADKVHCTSGAVKTAVLEHGVEDARTVVVPNFINPDVFSPRSAYPDYAGMLGLPRSCKPILHVGRKNKAKNLETVIAALRYLPEDYVTIFIGRGDDAPYKKLAEKLNVSSRCFWIDHVANSELPNWYSWCEVMCTPSRWEGFGIVFAEALACGARIVTSDISPMNEYLVNNENAVLVKDFENPQALAEGILRFSDKGFSSAVSAQALVSSKKFHRERVQGIEAREMVNTVAQPKTPAASRKLRLRALHYFNS